MLPAISPTAPPPPPPPPPPNNHRRRQENRSLHPRKAAVLLDGCSSVRHLREIHAAILRWSLLPEHTILNLKLQRRYSSLGLRSHHLSLFHLTPSHLRSVHLWSFLIHSHPHLSLHHLSLMLSSSVTPNSFTLSSALPSSSLPTGRALHSLSFKLHLSSDPYVASALLSMYSRAGDITSARKLFDEMPHPTLVPSTAMITCLAKAGHLDEARKLFNDLNHRDSVCWNTMIDGYVQHGRPSAALALFRQMLLLNSKPDEVTVLSSLSACAQLCALEAGRWMHSYIESSSTIHLTVRLGASLIDMYCKCGSLEEAQLVFEKIQGKDVVCFNAMMAGFAMHGRSEDALRTFSLMHSSGIHPTDITFISILNACSHGGLVEQGKEIFRKMDDYGIDPKVEHYGCLVDLLGRAGFVEEAYGVVKEMRGVEPDAVMWVSLLASCRLHNQLGLGKRIADSLVDSGAANSGSYVLLSNIYAAVGDWKGVAAVRAMMRSSGIQKEPGCTSIEIDNEVHEFLVGDISHPMSEKIYTMLGELMELFKQQHGYVPQTDLVLHDMEEVEKERVLGVHSEKLAISFGLISTRPGTTIKIAKNLRVCADCHNVTKLISKVTGRRIVVRDRNRFHHFVDGSCSCGDFW